MFPDLTAYGIDLGAGLARMDGNRALYLFFLSQFPHDESLTRVKSAVERGDAAEAFAGAHDLKGLSAQLGLTRLAVACGALCDCLGEPDYPPERVHSQLELVERAHAQALCGIALVKE